MAGFSFYTSINHQEKHFHAGFQVYVDGALRDFSSDAYMHVDRCIVPVAAENTDVADRAHLHSKIGDVAHVHKEGVLWEQLFVNLRFSIDTTKPLKAYINGLEIADILKKPIKPYDSLVILIGTYTDIPLCLTNSVTKEHILQTEAMVESCGK